MVTHFVGWAPFVVIAVIRLSNSSRFSFNFFTRLSMARLLKLSDSPPCLQFRIKIFLMTKKIVKFRETKLKRNIYDSRIFTSFLKIIKYLKMVLIGFKIFLITCGT